MSILRTCKVVDSHLGQGEQGHAIEVTLTDTLTSVSKSEKVAYFPARYQEVAMILARTLEERWRDEETPE